VTRWAPASRALWEEAARKSRHATFFHTPAWAAVFVRTYPKKFKAAALAAPYSGGQIVLPALEIYSEAFGAFKTFYSNWPGVYGGFLWTGAAPGTRELAEAAQSLQGPRAARWTVFGSPFVASDGAFGPGWRQKERETSLVELSRIKNEDELPSIYDSAARNKLNKARRAGFVVAPAASARDVSDYYEIYKESLRRWGKNATNRYDEALFQNFFALKAPEAVLWLVKKEGRSAGGSLNFYFNGHAVEWHGVCAEAHFKDGVRNFLADALMRDARRRGFQFYDFNPSGGHAGTQDFKASMGARKNIFTSHEWQNEGLYRVFKKIKDRVGR
jgi:hypothetical protein